MLRVSFSIASMLLALCFFIHPVLAGDDEIWMSSAIREAERDGYKLLDTKGLEKLMDSGTEMLIIDARADYEFEGGHIPGSTNLEFDLGDRTELSENKQAALAELAGPDKKRIMVLYCRSFR